MRWTQPAGEHAMMIHGDGNTYLFTKRGVHEFPEWDGTELKPMLSCLFSRYSEMGVLLYWDTPRSVFKHISTWFKLK